MHRWREDTDGPPDGLLARARGAYALRPDAKTGRGEVRLCSCQGLGEEPALPGAPVSQ